MGLRLGGGGGDFFTAVATIFKLFWPKKKQPEFQTAFFWTDESTLSQLALTLLMLQLQ